MSKLTTMSGKSLARKHIFISLIFFHYILTFYYCVRLILFGSAGTGGVYGDEVPETITMGCTYSLPTLQKLEDKAILLDYTSATASQHIEPIVN